MCTAQSSWCNSGAHNNAADTQIWHVYIMTLNHLQNLALCHIQEAKIRNEWSLSFTTTITKKRVLSNNAHNAKWRRDEAARAMRQKKGMSRHSARKWSLQVGEKVRCYCIVSFIYGSIFLYTLWLSLHIDAGWMIDCTLCKGLPGNIHAQAFLYVFC